MMRLNDSEIVDTFPVESQSQPSPARGHGVSGSQVFHEFKYQTTTLQHTSSWLHALICSTIMHTETADISITL